MKKKKTVIHRPPLLFKKGKQEIKMSLSSLSISSHPVVPLEGVTDLLRLMLAEADAG